MPRCVRQAARLPACLAARLATRMPARRAAVSCAAAALLSTAAPLAAQTPQATLAEAAATAPLRHFPVNALRGTLQLTQPPEALLNGQAARLSPGARLRGANNLLLVSGALVGQPLLVHYTTDTLGQLHQVWVLSAEEAARKPWPTNPDQAQRWRFNPSEQRWTQP